MNYLSSDQVKKYILLNFILVDLFCLFDLLNFQKTQVQSRIQTGANCYLEIHTNCFNGRKHFQAHCEQNHHDRIERVVISLSNDAYFKISNT